MRESVGGNLTRNKVRGMEAGTEEDDKGSLNDLQVWRQACRQDETERERERARERERDRERERERARESERERDRERERETARHHHVSRGANTVTQCAFGCGVSSDWTCSWLRASKREREREGERETERERETGDRAACWRHLISRLGDVGEVPKSSTLK